MRAPILLCALFPFLFGAASTATSPTTTPATTQSVSAKVAEFQGEYRFLSNFWPAEVCWSRARRMSRFDAS